MKVNQINRNVFMKFYGNPSSGDLLEAILTLLVILDHLKLNVTKCQP